MFCPKCGSQVPDGTKFCPKCGNVLGGGAPAPQPAPAGAGGQNVAYTPVAPANKGTNKGVIIGLAVVAVAIVAALVFFLVSCMGGNSYVGTWEGTAEYSGVEVDCTLTLNDDKSAEIELSYMGHSETQDGLEWRESDNGVEIATEGKDDWEELEKDGDSLVIEESGVTIEVTKK